MKEDENLDKTRVKGIPVPIAVILMIILTIVIAFTVYTYVSGKILVEYSQDKGLNFLIDNPTILEIGALIIIVVAISYWLRLHYKSKKNKKRKLK